MQNAQSSIICTLRAMMVDVMSDKMAVMTRMNDMQSEP